MGTFTVRLAASFVGDQLRVYVSLMLALSATVSVTSFQALAADEKPAPQKTSVSSESMLGSSKRLLKRHKYDDATNLLKTVAEKEPSWVAAHELLGQALYNTKTYKPAIEEYNRAIELLEGCEDAQTALKLHAIDRAAKDGTQWKTDRDLQLRTERAQAEHFGGDYEAALKDYTWIAEHGGATEDLYLRSASTHDALGQTPQAIEDLTQAVKLHPKEPDIYLRRALLYKFAKENDKAMADFSEAIRLKPSLITWRGSFYVDQGKPHAAIEDFTKAIQANSGCSKAAELCNRASVYADLDHHRKAIEDLSAAIKLEPQKADYFSCRGVSHFGVSDFKRAIADFTEAIKRAPKDADNYFKRAEACAVDGQRELALKDYDQAINLNPNKAGAYYFRRALVLADIDRNKAIEDLNKAVSLEPNNAEYWFNRALEYRAQDDWKHAENDFSKAIELHPQFATAYKYRGAARAKLGEETAAMEDLQKSIELYQLQHDMYGCAEVKRLLTRLGKAPVVSATPQK